MEFKELPSNIRVKLDESTENQLWKMINEFGGVKQFADNFDYSASKMYNWKNKDVFLPIDLVRKILGNNAADGVIAIKGGSRSKPLKNPSFPLAENDELLTRISSSVYVNSDGVPVYQVDDVGLANRFVELLALYGDFPVEVYNRSVYEVRYPKYMQDIFNEMSFDENFSTLVDEEGRIENNSIIVDDREVNVHEFDGRLYSRGKRLNLALARGDSNEVADIMAEEAERIQSLS